MSGQGEEHALERRRADGGDGYAIRVLGLEAGLGVVPTAVPLGGHFTARRAVSYADVLADARVCALVGHRFLGGSFAAAQSPAAR